MQKRVYLAGPMTGRPAYNLAAFEFYAAKLTDAGYSVTTPFECNSRVWEAEYGRPFDPTTDRCDYGDPLLAKMFAADVATLADADVVYFLPEWTTSRGAKLEFALARAMAKPCRLAATDEEIRDESIVAVQPTGPITAEAQSLVYGDRNASYGHPHDDYTTTARLWEAYLNLPEGRIGAKHAAMMMALVKVSRESRRPKRDNLVDLAGYAECAWRIDQRNAGRE